MSAQTALYGKIAATALIVGVLSCCLMLLSTISKDDGKEGIGELFALITVCAMVATLGAGATFFLRLLWVG
jgi:hypothetical protein